MGNELCKVETDLTSELLAQYLQQLPATNGHSLQLALVEDKCMEINEYRAQLESLNG